MRLGLRVMLLVKIVGGEGWKIGLKRRSVVVVHAGPELVSDGHYGIAGMVSLFEMVDVRDLRQTCSGTAAKM